MRRKIKNAIPVRYHDGLSQVRPNAGGIDIGGSEQARIGIVAACCSPKSHRHLKQNETSEVTALMSGRSSLVGGDTVPLSPFFRDASALVYMTNRDTGFVDCRSFMQRVARIDGEGHRPVESE